MRMRPGHFSIPSGCGSIRSDRTGRSTRGSTVNSFPACLSAMCSSARQRSSAWIRRRPMRSKCRCAVASKRHRATRWSAAPAGADDGAVIPRIRDDRLAAAPAAQLQREIAQAQATGHTARRQAGGRLHRGEPRCGNRFARNRRRLRGAGSEVAISGFSNSFAHPDLLAGFWADVIKSSGIDLLLFQDGVGEGKVALEDIGLYYAPLNSAVQRAGAQLGAVVELFSLMPNGRRVSAMIARVREQIAAADRLTSFPPVAFSVPDYMSSMIGQQAGALLANFLSARKGCRG
jgi:hypothetical protein